VRGKNIVFSGNLESDEEAARPEKSVQLLANSYLWKSMYKVSPTVFFPYSPANGWVFSSSLLMLLFIGLHFLVTLQTEGNLPFSAPVPFSLLILFGIGDFRRIYLLIWATIPFAIEVNLPGGLSTDFPAVMLMWLTCLLFLGYLFLYHKKINFRFILHPLFYTWPFIFFWISLLFYYFN
jgi:hypothetical protein